MITSLHKRAKLFFFDTLMWKTFTLTFFIKKKKKLLNLSIGCSIRAFHAFWFVRSFLENFVWVNPVKKSKPAIPQFPLSNYLTSHVWAMGWLFLTCMWSNLTYNKYGSWFNFLLLTFRWGHSRGARSLGVGSVFENKIIWWIVFKIIFQSASNQNLFPKIIILSLSKL